MTKKFSIVEKIQTNTNCSIEIFNLATSNMEFGTGFLFECILNEGSIVGIMTCNHVIPDMTYLETALLGELFSKMITF